MFLIKQLAPWLETFADAGDGDEGTNRSQYLYHHPVNCRPRDIKADRKNIDLTRWYYSPYEEKKTAIYIYIYIMHYMHNIYLPVVYINDLCEQMANIHTRTPLQTPCEHLLPTPLPIPLRAPLRTCANPFPSISPAPIAQQLGRTQLCHWLGL